MIFTLLALVLMAFIAACEGIPNPPAVTVVVTVVDDTSALDQAVANAVVGTDQAHQAETATVFAQGGVTLTPSPTLTPTFTATASPTRYVTPSRTPPASETPTATFIPYLTNTAVAVQEGDQAWIRILHAWRDLQGRAPSTNVDVYVNEERISRALALGEQTTYMQVLPGQVRINLRTVDANAATPTALLINEVVSIIPGTITSIVLADLGQGLELFPVKEDLSPLTTNQSRLTIVQANPELIPINMFVPATQRTLTTDLVTRGVSGPLDLPSGNYTVDLYDVKNPGVILETLPTFDLIPRLNYIMVMSPYRDQGQRFTSTLLFSGSTRLIETDLNARFINFASDIGPLNIAIDGQNMFNQLPVGSVSAGVPVSNLGSRTTITDASGNMLYEGVLGPWTTDAERESDKIFLISANTSPATQQSPITITALSQNPPTSAINASIRLIHALPGGVPISLEIRRVAAQAALTPGFSPSGNQTPEVPWVAIAQASLGTASNYASRTPEVFDVRVVQAGTRTPLAQINNVQLLAGAIYDFVVLPGTEAASARLELIQPSVQVTTLAVDTGNPEYIQEAVQATIASLVTQVSPTATGMNTATPTLTPVATNTPRASYTPSIAQPSLIIDPVPPNATGGVVTVIGQNFTPGRPYSIRIDTNPTDLANGVVNSDGTLGQVVTLPFNIAPGPHTIRVCVDCLSGGNARQEQFAVVIVAEANTTPTVTAQP
jgi:hypothetical protein